MATLLADLEPIQATLRPHTRERSVQTSAYQAADVIVLAVSLPAFDPKRAFSTLAKVQTW